MIQEHKRRRIALIVLMVMLTSSAGFVMYEYLSPKIPVQDVYALSDEKAYAVSKNLVSSFAGFAFKIFNELSIEDGDGNVFISPLSISIALLMTYNGAGGTTMDAMARVLEVRDMSLVEINHGCMNLIGSLENADRLVKLSIANSIWIRDDFEPLVKKDFIQRLKEYFMSEVFLRNFGNPQTLDEINGWVSGRTDGKIDRMVEKMDPQLVMFLINAMYFKGEWVTSFNKTATKKACFFLSDGGSVEVDMMSTTGNFSYYEGEGFRAVRLPYGRGKIAMYVFLPDRGVSLNSFINSLTKEVWENYMGGFRLVEGLEVKFPKFKLEYGIKRLNGALEKLGMRVAFDPNNANFTGIAPAQLYIEFVDHKAIIEVNEEGTVAAAATAVGVSLTSIPSNPLAFIVDRPFFFAIVDDRSEAILFIGKVTNPAA